jgi:hypothetical protein
MTRTSLLTLGALAICVGAFLASPPTADAQLVRYRYGPYYSYGRPYVQYFRPRYYAPRFDDWYHDRLHQRRWHHYYWPHYRYSHRPYYHYHYPHHGWY